MDNLESITNDGAIMALEAMLATMEEKGRKVVTIREIKEVLTMLKGRQ